MRRRRKRPKRRGYVRPSRAKPKTGWSLRELANLGGVAGRTIRLYLQRGLVPRRFMGSATRYQAQHLLWLLATRRLRTTEKLPLSKIRNRLQALSASELEAFATENLAAGPVADALGIKPASAPASPAPPALSSPQFPRWVRFELALGLELHVRDDASAPVAELARRLRELCASAMR
jgi:DNA-binding transcriptional MerR regulator